MGYISNIFGKIGSAVSGAANSVGSVLNGGAGNVQGQGQPQQTPAAPASPATPKLTMAQFSQKIKRQYPQYKNADDQTLVEKIIAKYPSYKDKVNMVPTGNTVEPTLGGAFKTGIKETGQQVARNVEGLYSGFVKPFVQGIGSAARAAQATPSLFKAAVGGFDRNGILNDQADIHKAEQIMAKPILGAKTMSGQTPIENIGMALQIGSNLFGLGGEGIVAKTTAGAVVDATKVASEQGATMSAGQYLENADKPTVLGTAGAALSGGAQGAFMGATAAAISPVMTGQMSLSEFGKQFTPSGIKAKLSEAAQASLKQTYEETFNATKSGKKGLVKSEAAGKDPSGFLAKKGYIVDVKGSKFDTQPTIEKIYNDVQPLEKSLDDILAAKDKTLPDANRISLDDMAAKTKARIATPLNKASGTLNTQNAAIDNLFADLKSQYGDTINYSKLNKIKQAQWQQSKVFDATKPKWMSDLNYNTGKVAQGLIESSVPEASIHQLNSEIGDYMDAAKNLKKLDGGAVKGGRLGKYVNRAIGTMIGVHVGGLPGAAAGDLAGGYITDLMQNNSIAGPIKRAALEAIPEDSAVYDQAQQALSKIKYGQPLLGEPAPGTPKSSNNVPIEMPAKYSDTAIAKDIKAGENAPVRKLKVSVTGGDDVASQIRVFKQQMGLGKVDAISQTGGSVFKTSLQNNPPPEYAGMSFDEVGKVIDQNNIDENNQAISKGAETPYESWTTTVKQGYSKFKQVFNAWKDSPEDFAQLSKTDAGSKLKNTIYEVAKEMGATENDVFDMFQSRIVEESKKGKSLFGK